MKIYLLFFLVMVVFVQCGHKTDGGASLENTYWRLAEFNGNPLTTPEGRKEVYIQMKPEGEDKKLSGFAGCNSIGGSYTADDDAVTFKAVSTRMACAEGMDVENFLQFALSNADGYTITGQNLELYKGKSLLARFEAKPM